jgi:type IV pilus assembly protein PilV
MHAGLIRATAHHQQLRGFTLLEVLIALVVLSVGLLGIASMIVMSIKTGDSSYMRTQATDMAYDIIDRVRGNLTTAENGTYNLALGTTISAPSPTCVGSANTCTANQLASYDEYIWQQNVASLMPSGEGTVSVASVGNAWQITVVVYWCDQRANQALGNNTGCTGTPVAPPNTALPWASVQVIAGL